MFPRGAIGKRLDMHPMARPLFERAVAEGGPVYYALEGCLKADAILSAGYAVFSVPAVGMWKPAELEAFAAQLRGVKVYVVADADALPHPERCVKEDCKRKPGESNLDVLTFGLETAWQLRQWGADAEFVAPPPIRLDGSEYPDCKTGVDDFLFAGHDLNDLIPIAREDPDREVVEGQVLRALRAVNPRRQMRLIKFVTDVLIWHILHADEVGRVLGSLDRCTRMMFPEHFGQKTWEGKRKLVSRARAHLRDAGLLEQVEPLQRRQDWNTREWYVLPPVEVIVNVPHLGGKGED